MSSGQRPTSAPPGDGGRDEQGHADDDTPLQAGDEQPGAAEQQGEQQQDEGEKHDHHIPSEEPDHADRSAVTTPDISKDRETITVRVPPDLLARVDAEAEARDLSRSKIVEIALKRGLDHLVPLVWNKPEPEA